MADEKKISEKKRRLPTPPNLGKYGGIRLLEEEYHRRMWAGEENCPC